MIRPYVHSFDVPPSAYRRPLLMAPSIGRALFEHVCDRDVELARLVAEQAAEMAADKSNAAQLELDGANEGQGGPTNAK